MPAYTDLSVYSGLVAACGTALVPDRAVPASEVRAALRFGCGVEQPANVERVATWQADGIDCEEIAWSAGFGPQTRAIFLKPAGARAPLRAQIG